MKFGGGGRAQCAHAHTQSLVAVAVLPSSLVKVESSRVGDAASTRKQHKVHKTNFINPIAVVTNTEAENT